MSDDKKNLSNYLVRHLTLRQIQVFEAVARYQSFTRAAEALYLTQPTVSTQIKSFQESLDVSLYEQIGRNIFLTDVGEQVAVACREILGNLSNLEINLNDFKGKRKGRLRITAVTSAKYFLPLALGEFVRSYPEIDLEFTVCNRDTLLKRIDENLDDLYIMGQKPPSSLDVVDIPFTPNPLVLIAHKDHPFVGRRQIPLVEIAKEPILMREIGSGTRSAVEEKFKQAGLKLNVRLTLESTETIKQAVFAHLGIAVVPMHSVYLDGAKGPISVLDVEGFPLEKSLNIVYPTGKSLSIIARAFLDLLQQKGAQYFQVPRG
jgi:DNA-binding transcriptional LysR family regulator